MRWGSAVMGLVCIAGCGNLAQADALAAGSGAMSSSTTGEGSESSTGPIDADLDVETEGSDSTSTTEDSGSDGSTGDPIDPAGIAGIHDGLYTGTVSIEFVSAGACTGEISITVDSGMDPPILGTGSCQGEIFGLPEGGATEVDGELEFDGPQGTATQVLDGEEVEVSWVGAFGGSNFTGTFEGEVELFGTDVEFHGVWNADR